MKSIGTATYDGAAAAVHHVGRNKKKYLAGAALLLAVGVTTLVLQLTMGLDKFGDVFNSKVIQPIGAGLQKGDFNAWQVILFIAGGAAGGGALMYVGYKIHRARQNARIGEEERRRDQEEVNQRLEGGAVIHETDSGAEDEPELQGPSRLNRAWTATKGFCGFPSYERLD